MANDLVSADVSSPTTKRLMGIPSAGGFVSSPTCLPSAQAGVFRLTAEKTMMEIDISKPIEFSPHAQEKMIDRGASESEVQSAIRRKPLASVNSQAILSRHGKGEPCSEASPTTSSYGFERISPLTVSGGGNIMLSSK